MPSIKAQSLHGLVAATHTPFHADGSLNLGVIEKQAAHLLGASFGYSGRLGPLQGDIAVDPLTSWFRAFLVTDVPVELRCAAADWEVELVVVIGRQGRDIAAADAWSQVVGVTVGQDISDRTLQFAAKPPHFDLGKSRDGYGPIGPLLVSVDCLAKPDDLALTCDVNGERKQSDRTSNLIFTVPDLIVYLSGIMTLAPGDIIFTGTPSGVGAASNTFLKAGDEIVSAIEGIGTLTTRCVA